MSAILMHFLKLMNTLLCHQLFVEERPPRKLETAEPMNQMISMKFILVKNKENILGLSQFSQADTSLWRYEEYNINYKLQDYSEPFIFLSIFVWNWTTKDLVIELGRQWAFSPLHPHLVVNLRRQPQHHPHRRRTLPSWLQKVVNLTSTMRYSSVLWMLKSRW